LNGILRPRNSSYNLAGAKHDHGEMGKPEGLPHLLHDRDAKFCPSFRELIKTGSVNPLRLPARSPNLNSYAERWVRSVEEECLSRLVLFGRIVAAAALQQYMEHYHGERSHQGKDNRILFPSPEARGNTGAVRRRAAGTPAEVLRERSGIRIDGKAGDGLTISTSHILKDAGNLPETSRA